MLLVGGGILADLDAPRIEANLPTPWAGVTERVNIVAYMLWVVVPAIALLRRQRLAGAIRFEDTLTSG